MQVWDGTYPEDGRKHRKYVYSKKSSGDLEKKAAAFKRKAEEAQRTVFSDQSFTAYANDWLRSAKEARERNTVEMYRNIINVHLAHLRDVPVSKIRHSHFQETINMAAGKPRTCEQIALTFRQIIKSAIRDHILPRQAYGGHQRGHLPARKDASAEAPAERRREAGGRRRRDLRHQGSLPVGHLLLRTAARRSAGP